MFIAEQQLVAAAVGLSVRGYLPFASTFAAFLTRAYDFIRMAADLAGRLRLVGSHAGVEIGADGPSQMALEDLAMMRAVHGSTVLYPSDATSTAALVDAMADRTGVSYLRTTRGAYPVLYDADEPFPVGGSKLLRSGPTTTHVTLIGAGVTAARLPRRRRPARARRHPAPASSTCYSVKPIDADDPGRRRRRPRRPARRRRGPPSRGRPRLGGRRRAARRGSSSNSAGAPERVRAAWLRHDRRVAGRGRHRRHAHRIGSRRVDRRMMRNGQPRNPRGHRSRPAIAIGSEVPDACSGNWAHRW